jgi:hypothetical protein
MPIFINQFAYSVDYSTTTMASHKGFDTVLGFKDEEVTFDFLMGLYHPNEADQVMELTARVVEWSILFPSDPFSIVFSLTHRVRKADGQYIKILRQTTIFEIDAAGKCFQIIRCAQTSAI